MIAFFFLLKNLNTLLATIIFTIAILNIRHNKKKLINDIIEEIAQAKNVDIINESDL